MPQSEDRQAVLLRELNEIRKSNPLQVYNLAHPLLPPVNKKQLAFHAIKPPPLGVKALIAANRSGKTVGCVVDDTIQLIPEELVPPHLKAFKSWFEPIVVWIGAPKNENHFSNSIPLFRKFLPKAALVGGEFGKSFKSQPTPRLTLANGSEVVFKTYDQDVDSWASAETHRIHWDEEPNGANARELRTEARMRLVSTDGDEIVGMTPVLGSESWVNDEIWERRDDPSIFVVQMRMEDNPFNTPEAIKKAEEGLTAEEKRARIKGEFVSLGGLFFEEFSDRHIVDEIKPDHLKGQEIVVAIDPGRERTGVAWISFDKENAALVFDELNTSEAVVPEVAAQIKERNKFWGIREPTYVIDPSARNRSQVNADQVEAAYMREGVYCEHAQNSRSAGILEIKKRLQAKPEPTLHFTRKCEATIHQMRRYARDPRSKDEWAAVPQNARTRFDLVDTVRYGVMARTYFDPDDPPPERPAYHANYQPPASDELFPEPAPPMGAFT